jgi:hypothetical protein
MEIVGLGVGLIEPIASGFDSLENLFQAFQRLAIELFSEPVLIDIQALVLGNPI